jgi:hypothetical protein
VATVTSAAPAALRLPTPLRRALILGAPLVLAVYEIFHPRPDVTVEGVMEVAGWFALFHAIQLVLFSFLMLSIAYWRRTWVCWGTG